MGRREDVELIQDGAPTEALIVVIIDKQSLRPEQSVYDLHEGRTKLPRPCGLSAGSQGTFSRRLTPDHSSPRLLDYPEILPLLPVCFLPFS